MKSWEIKRTLYGKEIVARITCLDQGLVILLAGGDKSHVGAVTVAGETGTLNTIQLPGHKEAVLSERWAGAVFEKFQVPVVVEAGIHYDEASKEQIFKVVETAEEMLGVILDWEL